MVMRIQIKIYKRLTLTRKLCYRKDDRAMRLIYEFPESFWMCIENLKCVALAVPEIIAIAVLVGGCGLVNPNPVEEEVVGGRGWYH